jgi:DNA-binding IclR family transcriptional regulator
VESPRPIRYTVRVGERWPLYCTSAGKLYLARLSDDEVRDLLAGQPLEEFTESTPTTVDRVIEDLRLPRQYGFAFNREEIVPGVTGCGAPVLTHGGRLVAALSVVGPTERIEPQTDNIVATLLSEARRLSEALDDTG